MKKNKFKCLIVILALCIANNPLKVLADTTNRNIQQSGDTVLDGEIGEWDPGISGTPGNGMDIEGDIPNSDEYFTISVTVPVAMEFMVLPSSTSPFGSFYSPNYTIKNNGSKTIVSKILSFEMDNIVNANDETPLYIEKVVGGNGRTQMELSICTLDGSILNNIDKKVDLTKIKSLNEEERTLYELQANDSKQVKFHSDRWERPEYESNKDKAVSSYTALFEFSIANP